MKIRIKGDSIRLRLTKSEIEQFATHGNVAEETHIGTSVWRYELIRDKDATSISAAISGTTITVSMPASEAHHWSTTERVGYETNMPLENGKHLFILLEKDFKCLDNTQEDQSDMYENPLAESHP
jgi:hypothetical protein